MYDGCYVLCYEDMDLVMWNGNRTFFLLFDLIAPTCRTIEKGCEFEDDGITSLELDPIQLRGGKN